MVITKFIPCLDCPVEGLPLHPSESDFQVTDSPPFFASLAGFLNCNPPPPHVTISGKILSCSSSPCSGLPAAGFQIARSHMFWLMILYCSILQHAHCLQIGFYITPSHVLASLLLFFLNRSTSHLSPSSKRDFYIVPPKYVPWQDNIFYHYHTYKLASNIITYCTTIPRTNLPLT
jgi:hypothetical protein